ncbi:MAG: hypothetical protein ACK5PB_00625 [Pirellula sp.]|jgi:hypothetical protein
MFQSNRTFKIWEYRVSHQQLLVRSPRAPEVATNIDLVFWGVKAIKLETIVKGVDIAPDNSNVSDDALAKYIENGYTKFVLDGKGSYVIASGMKVLENEMDIFESSLTSFNDNETPDIGRVLVQSVAS